VTINLKIELLKVFSIEFNLSSDNEFKFKKGKPNEKEYTATASSDTKQPGKG